MPDPAPPPIQLRQSLSLFDATMINVGTIIASGIFFVPATIAQYVSSPGLIILAWVVAGVVSLLGALSIAELGAAMPRAGGMYVYLREAYGPAWGFMYGWSAFAVTNTASIAAIAVGFATYFGYFVPLEASGIRLVAVVSIIALTLLNCAGLEAGAWTQNLLTLAKLGAFGFLILFSAILPGGSSAHFSPFLPDLPLGGLIGPFGLALVAALWAYDGWIEVTFVSSEVKNPERAIPRSIIYSTVIVVLVYVLVNLAYIYVLSPEGMAGSKLVASDAAIVLIGGAGAAAIAAAVMVSTLGSNNGIIFTAARVPFAMAREGEFFRALGRVHPRFHTPHIALLVQGAWACLLTLTGTYNQLITYIIFAEFLFYGMAAAAVILLRRRRSDLHRPYKVRGYPFPPALFVLFAAGLVVNTILEDPRDALIGAGIIMAGLPAYLFWRKMNP